MVRRLGGKAKTDETGQVGKRVSLVMEGLISHFKEVRLPIP